MSFSTSGGLVMLEPSIVSTTCCFPQRLTGSRIDRDQRAVERADEDAVAENRDAAGKRIDFVRVDDLLLPRPPPDLPARSRVNRGDGRRVAAAGRVHHAVDDERRRFEHGVAAEDRKAPCGLQLTRVVRRDLRERRVMLPGVIAPVHQPVVRLGSRVEEPLIGDAAAQSAARRSCSGRAPAASAGTRRCS